jgi:ABC-type multidrug transport system fused ATPase/permease subunit
LQAISKARESGFSIYSLLNIEPTIKIHDPAKKVIGVDFKGEIELRDVSFSYPSRKEVEILKDVSFKVTKG